MTGALLIAAGAAMLLGATIWAMSVPPKTGGMWLSALVYAGGAVLVIRTVLMAMP